MDQLMLFAMAMIALISFAIPWRGLSLADSEQPPWDQRRTYRGRRGADIPDLVVPPGKRSKNLKNALKRVQQAAPEAVHREQGGARRYTLVPRIRQEIHAVLEDCRLADAEARELRRAFETKSTYILGTHSPPASRSINVLESLILKCAAAPIPDGARWRQEWMAEYLSMMHYPAYSRIRFLTGLLIAAPKLSLEEKRSRSCRNRTGAAQKRSK